jgi:hypothetical protein
LQPQDSSRDVDDDKRDGYPRQQAYYPPNENAWTLPQGYSLVKNNGATVGQQRGYSDEAIDGPNTLMPPDQGYENQGRSPSPLPALAGKVMDYAMSAKGGKSGKNGGGKGSDMLAGLFSN